MKIQFLEPLPPFRMPGADICTHKRALRIFWRGFSYPQRPYFYHRWGFYGFGVGPVGFMFWPHTQDEK